MRRVILVLLVTLGGVGAVAGAILWRSESYRVRRVPLVGTPAARYVEEVRDLPRNEASSVSSPHGRFVGYTTMRVDEYPPVNHDGYHTLTVLDAGAGNGVVREVVTFREPDPGSGRYHWLGWSADGHALLVGGYGSLAGEVPAELCLIYLPASDELYRPAKCGR